MRKTSTNDAKQESKPMQQHPEECAAIFEDNSRHYKLCKYVALEKLM
jgi:hypothetical protein